MRKTGQGCGVDVREGHGSSRALRYARPVEKFKQQARQAKQRGIEWLLTFDEWMSAWRDSGKWDERGKRIGQYVMARRGDVGPYALDNIYFCLASENHTHAFTNGRVPPRGEKKPKRPPRVVRGWTLLNRGARRYQVMKGDRYIGRFATQQEAEDAYRAACELELARHAAIVFRSPGAGTPKHP